MEAESGRESLINRLVKYYLSDYNLSENRDFKREFLRYKNGWIPVAFLIRNCHYVGELSNEDEAVLFDALKKDTTGFLKLREYPPQLCRPKRPNDSKDVISRSIYCKGFPINIIKSKDRQQLDPFFNQFPTVVKLKVRNPNQGSLIAQFQTRHQAEKFLNQETVKFDDCFIDRQWIADWEIGKFHELEREVGQLKSGIQN